MGGYNIYQGYRRQRGAGVLGSFRQAVAPIGARALSGMTNLAQNKLVQNIGKQVAAKGADVLTGVAIDALYGRNIGQSLKERSKEVALKTLTGRPGGPNPRPITVKKKQLKQTKQMPHGNKSVASKGSINTVKHKHKRRRPKGKLSRALKNRRLLF